MQENKYPISELSFTTYQWLTACGIKASKNFLKDELTAHPDYPALTSVVDLLDAGNMNYLAVRTDMQHANEFRYPLLAHIQRSAGNQEIILVSNKKDWESDSVLKSHWSGVLLMPGENAQWNHADNDEYIRTENSRKNLSIAALVGLLITAVLTATQQTGVFNILFSLLSATRLIIAWLTFTTELGLQNKLVKQVCNSVNPTGGCNKVLKSKQAGGLLGITPADAAVGWFAIQWIFIIAGTWILELAPLKIIAVQFGLAGIIAAVWSIISQKFIVKQWCALCLGIAAVLLLQFIIAVSNIPTVINIKAGLVYLLSLPFILFLIIFPVKQLLKISVRQKPLQQQLKKWKQDINVFMGLWQQQPLVDCTPWEHELQMGNPDAPVQITVACNPYCGPCAVAHKKLDGLLEKYHDKLEMSVRFSIQAKKIHDVRTKAVELILQNHLQHSKAERSLSDWFAWMNEEKWTGKYKPDTTIDVKNLLQQHDDWTMQTGIAFTPTFFLNGRQVPGQYNLDEVGNLLPQLIALLQPVEELVA